MLQSYKINIIRQRKLHEISRGCMFLVHPRPFSCIFVSKASPLWLNRQKVYYHKSKTEDAIKGAVWYSDLFVCYSIGIMPTAIHESVRNAGSGD